MVEEKRDIGLFILLNIVTCGIYSFVFIYKLAQDINTVCAGDGEETPGVEYYILFSLLTCGIYSFYYLYKVGNRLEANGRRYNTYIQESGTTVLIWLILGSWVAGVGFYVAMYIIIKNMNLLARAYNRNMGGVYGNAGAQGYGNPDFNSQNGAYAQGYNQNMGTNQSYITLYCKNGEFAGSSFPIHTNETIIMGRDGNCNIRFSPNTPNVSRVHCAVRYDGNNIILTDQGSTYGTFLTNGRRLGRGESITLLKGSGFYVGSEQISFSVM